MAFFDQKEEVMDVKLTQFGKNCLARGVFKPAYYQFFDDDILYNSRNGGFSEHQNDSEVRILTETPKLKTLHLTYSVKEQYKVDDQLIVDRLKPRFMPLRQNVDPDLQSKILIYPMAEQEISSNEYPRFSVVSNDAPFTQVAITFLTSSQVIRKVPQIQVNPKFTISRSNSNSMQERITEEDHYDLMSNEITFSDNSKIIKTEENFLIDLEEIGSFHGLDNFEVEIYEVLQNDDREFLLRIDDRDQINTRFEIKTDSDVEGLKPESAKQTNYRKRGEV